MIDTLATGVPSISSWAMISEVIVEFAVIVGGRVWTIEISPMDMVTEVDWFSVPHSAVMFAIPVSVPGVKVMIASPSSLVIDELKDRIPRDGSASVEKVTISPGIGLPLSDTFAVILEVIVEFAATGDSVESDKSPELMLIVVCSDSIPQSAVIVAVPVFVPGENVTVAYP